MDLGSWQGTVSDLGAQLTDIPGSCVLCRWKVVWKPALLSQGPGGGVLDGGHLPGGPWPQSLPQESQPPGLPGVAGAQERFKQELCQHLICRLLFVHRKHPVISSSPAPRAQLPITIPNTNTVDNNKHLISTHQGQALCSQRFTCTTSFSP